MDENTPPSLGAESTLRALVTVLKAVVERLQEPPHLLVVGVSVVIVILVLVVVWFAPTLSGPLYAALGVIGVLSLAALTVDIIAALAAARRSQLEKPHLRQPRENAPEQSQPRTGDAPQTGRETTHEHKETPVKERTSPTGCSHLRRLLDSAQRTLDELEVQAAGIPELERRATFSRNLSEQRERVKKLEQRLADCLEREAQG